LPFSKTKTMQVTLVHVWVKTDKIDDFIKVSRTNHLKSIEEPGNLRFDILQDASNPSKFTFYEAYESEEAVKAHKNTSHYEVWRDTVADWMEKPREGVKHVVVCPEDIEKW
jgi:(4S)-4-hydroxy-5-phosphonooxypentane-2,3-dione isomerase